MVVRQVLNAYRKTEKQVEIHPVKLIHMLYERALTHLDFAEEGIREKNPKKRGENLSKVIAIITELNASLRPEDESEAAQFLRGLYNAILVEVPKVAVSGDIQILRQSARYIKQLKEIWEQTAMQEHGFDVNGLEKCSKIDSFHVAEERSGYEGGSVPLAGVSVSI